MARIVFMGTPNFAKTCLMALIELLEQSEHSLIGVFTKPDQPKNRGLKVEESEVKILAKEYNIPIFTPNTFKKGTEEGEVARQLLSDLKPDLILVSAYGKILPEFVLNLPKYGCINVHASLLPRHRGASPVHHAILCGDKKTGISLMKMSKGLDEGPVYISKSIDIRDEHNAQTLMDDLANLAFDMIKLHLFECMDQRFIPTKQPSDGVTFAPLLTKEMAFLDFNKSAQEIFNQVRALYPWPGAQAYIDNGNEKILLKLFSCQIKSLDEDCTLRNIQPGTILNASKYLHIACKKGSVQFAYVQAPSKNKLSVEEAVRGLLYLKEGAIFY